jgi:hypothetical protein
MSPQHFFPAGERPLHPSALALAEGDGVTADRYGGRDNRTIDLLERRGLR